ncbi:MAG: hypothetical protein U5L72_09455 [Bacteroidales bacterium]|nr:hypothetical protein [Bacteroidales bacterium]
MTRLNRTTFPLRHRQTLAPGRAVNLIGLHIRPETILDVATGTDGAH